MKKIKFIFILTFGLLIANFTNAQKFGFVDSKFILSQLPEYKKAEKELDALSVGWQKEIEKMYGEIEKMYKEYQAEEILLTKEMRVERQDAIIKREKEVKEYQNKIFGYEGLLFLKRQELVKPAQDKVFEACESIARSKKLQIVFDKSSDLVMIYMNPMHDYTDYVLIELGLKEPVEEEE